MTLVYCAFANLHPLVNNNTLVTSICLGLQHQQLNYLPGINNSWHIDNYAHYANGSLCVT